MGIIKSNKRRTVIRSQPSTETNRKQVVVGPVAAPIQTNDSGHSIKLSKTGSRVDSIEVVCSCGERMIVRCNYE